MINVSAEGIISALPKSNKSLVYINFTIQGKQKIKKKCGTRTYYSIAKSTMGRKHPILNNIMYLGTAEKILEIFRWYKKNKKKS